MEPVTEPAVDRDALLAKAMKAVALENGAAVWVAVFDIDAGEGAAYGEGAFDTASIVKVDILATLLLGAGRRPASDGGGEDVRHRDDHEQ